MTREELAIKILAKLGSYDKSTVDPADQKLVLDTYDGVYLELKDDGLVTWAQGADEDIPLRFANSLVRIVAAQLVDTYKQQEGTAQRFITEAGLAYKTIRRQLATIQPTEPVAAEYF